MSTAGLFYRAQDFLRRKTSTWSHRRVVRLAGGFPVISFTFDDFPKSAWECGGAILAAHGARGTYYTSFGLAGKQAPVGLCFDEGDVQALIEVGHELGCHTYSHCHAWNTPPDVFRRELMRNTAAAQARFPGQSMRTMSYPISGPRPGNKQAAGQMYCCARGGGQTFNVGMADANYLQAFFLEKSRDQPAVVQHLIEENSRRNGWLILATHDVTAHPSPFGCTPQFFDTVVGWAAGAGARILPVAAAWDALTTPAAGG